MTLYFSGITLTKKEASNRYVCVLNPENKLNREN
jgi:hypothetical protein